MNVGGNISQLIEIGGNELYQPRCLNHFTAYPKV